MAKATIKEILKSIDEGVSHNIKELFIEVLVGIVWILINSTVVLVAGIWIMQHILPKMSMQVKLDALLIYVSLEVSMGIVYLAYKFWCLVVAIHKNKVLKENKTE